MAGPDTLRSHLLFQDTELEDGKCRRGVIHSLQTWIYFPPEFIHFDTLFPLSDSQGEGPTL